MRLRPDAEDNTAAANGPVEWVTFTSDYGFTLQYPSNWVVVDDGVSGTPSVLRPYDGTQTTFLCGYTYERVCRLDRSRYGERNDLGRGAYPHQSRGRHIHRARGQSRLNGYPFTAQNYEVETEDGVYHGECYYAAKGEIGFEMYYSIQPDEYEALLPTLREIAQSFTFTD